MASQTPDPGCYKNEADRAPSGPVFISKDMFDHRDSGLVVKSEMRYINGYETIHCTKFWLVVADALTAADPIPMC